MEGGGGGGPAIMERRIEAWGGQWGTYQIYSRGGRAYHQGIGTVKDRGRQNSKGDDCSESGGSCEVWRVHGRDR